MKKIYYMLLAVLAMSCMLTACSEEEPFSTATADDDPRILDPIFTDGINGELPVIATLNRDVTFEMTLTVTPADYTTIVWLIDGQEVETGNTLEIDLKAGTYRFKVIVSTEAGKSTYREGSLVVNPLEEDPWSAETGTERIIVPGTKARLYGDNLDKVKSILIDNKTITDILYVADEMENYLEYTVPADLAEGEHRVVLVDTGNSEYGANKVIVTRGTLVTGGAYRTNANQEWVITGVNLDQVSSFTFAGQTITTFIQQTATEIVLICPDIEDGEYTLTGKTKNGDDVRFYNDKEIATGQVVIVSSETILFQGHHYVSWDLPDDSPNKTFNLIDQEVFASIKAGATLNIHYSVDPEADYHQLRTTTVWWEDLPGTSTIDFTEDGVLEILLTQEVLEKILAEDGFLCVGHGYFIDLVTVW
ncbi:MAG: hypothetical protein LIO97_10870 [Tannerellaceae bacterium]|nr:hypothetical protein [Tannerellaceae bacterium]